MFVMTRDHFSGHHFVECPQDDMAVEDLDNEDEDAGGDGASDKGGDVEAVTKGSWKRGKSMGHMSMAKSMRMTAGKLVAGVSGEFSREFGLQSRW